MPAFLTISRDSYSKKRTGRGTLSRPRSRGRSARHFATRTRSEAGDGAGGELRRSRSLEAVGLGELGVPLGELLRERDHHLALLPGGIVLHLAVDHVHAPAVGDRRQHLLGEPHLV